MIGNSRKNALYFAKYIDFFQTQFAVKVGNDGFWFVYQLIVPVNLPLKPETVIFLFLIISKTNNNRWWLFPFLVIAENGCVCFDDISKVGAKLHVELNFRVVAKLWKVTTKQLFHSDLSWPDLVAWNPNNNYWFDWSMFCWYSEIAFSNSESSTYR